MMDFANIKNIIFDLGNVIINIDPPRTYNAFARLSGHDIEEVYRRFQEHEVFDRYEKGLLNDTQLFALFRDILNIQASDQELIDAWNAMLLDIPEHRLSMLERLREKYNLYILSNTSVIHIREVNQILKRTSGDEDLNTFFDRIFYTYDMGLRKPDPEIYKRVLAEEGLNAGETVFIDDRKDNVEGAELVGIKAIHLEVPKDVTEYFINA